MYVNCQEYIRQSNAEFYFQSNRNEIIVMLREISLLKILKEGELLLIYLVMNSKHLDYNFNLSFFFPKWISDHSNKIVQNKNTRVLQLMDLQESIFDSR